MKNRTELDAVQECTDVLDLAYRAVASAQLNAKDHESQSMMERISATQVAIQQRRNLMEERGTAKPDALKTFLNNQIDYVKDAVNEMLAEARDTNSAHKRSLRRTHKALIGVDNIINDRLKAKVKRQGRQKKRRNRN